MQYSQIQPQIPLAHSELLDALSALRTGQKYSDLKIICNHREWAVHKAIICPRSGFFDGACSHEFRERVSGIIDLSEEDGDAVEQMINFFYYLDYLRDDPKQNPSAMFRHRAYSQHLRPSPKKIDFTQIEDPLYSQAGLYRRKSSQSSGDLDFLNKASHYSHLNRYTDTPYHPIDATSDEEVEKEEEEEEDDDIFQSTESESHLLLHAMVYAMAEKYDIPPLKQLAKKKFEISMACYYDAPELAEAIQHVYTSTIDSDRGLRDVVLQLFDKHPRVANVPDVLAVMQETPSLTWDLWKIKTASR